MFPTDPLDGPLEEARAAKAAAEREASRRQEEERQQQARDDAARERFGKELREVGCSFVKRATKLGIQPERVHVQVGTRDRHKGIIFRQKIGTTEIYERRTVWTIAASRWGGGYDPIFHPGIYVLDDGTILGALHIESLPGGTTRSVSAELARYLADRGG